jgi:hypothetical protein
VKILPIILLLGSFQAFSHSGGTDSSGCHNDHKNGGYHCHKSDDAPVKGERTPASFEEKEALEAKKDSKNNDDNM